MAQSLRELRQQVAAYTAGFDPALITTADAVVVVEDAAAIEKMAATLKALAAARMADAQTTTWGDDGETSAAVALAKKTGTSLGRAKDAIRTAKRLADQPELDAAARRGELSPEQAVAISDAVAADPGAESRLVRQARRFSLRELRDEAERTRAAADRDAEARHRRIHAARFARRRCCADGSAEVSYRSTGEDIAVFWAVVSGYANAAFAAARSAGRHEPAEAYAADGMLAMANAAAGTASPASSGERATGAGVGGPAATGDPAGTGPDLAAPGPFDHEPGGHTAAPAAPTGTGLGPATTGIQKSPVPTRIVVRIDWDALVRGFVAGGETCEVAGVGQVPVSVVRAMIDSGDAFLAAVVTKGVDVVNVAHLGRRPSAYQHSALDWLSPTCTVEHCDRSLGLEDDHRADWADTHLTLLRLIDRMCGHHHDLKTYRGWALVEGSGKRPMVAPDDPRHPKNRQKEPVGGAGDARQGHASSGTGAQRRGASLTQGLAPPRVEMMRK